ncbi:unnamed protein product [Haemonchus placei]|uniref:Methyltranfer_dom domain-containing protein n=1 Tax=Haemonchus placei TaxID=6290 RepID=A0A0N4W7D8_HAEPC|nr:unnamed protein product [Haemonchus placei]
MKWIGTSPKSCQEFLHEHVLRHLVYDDPTRVANEFRSEGGTIITIEYLQGTVKRIPMFKKLASPNYRLFNFRDANCFCKRKWAPYNKGKWNAPEGGCYLPVRISSTQVRFLDMIRS